MIDNSKITHIYPPNVIIPINENYNSINIDNIISLDTKYYIDFFTENDTKIQENIYLIIMNFMKKYNDNHRNIDIKMKIINSFHYYLYNNKEVIGYEIYNELLLGFVNKSIYCKFIEIILDKIISYFDCCWAIIYCCYKNFWVIFAIIFIFGFIGGIVFAFISKK